MIPSERAKATRPGSPDTYEKIYLKKTITVCSYAYSTVFIENIIEIKKNQIQGSHLSRNGPHGNG